MEGFLAWLVLTEDRARVSPGVLRGYEFAFKDQLQRVIHRTQNPALRAELEDMLHCPIRDARGNCKSFTNYIVGTLVKNGVHARYDLEAALAYVVEKMLMERGEHGEPRITVFGGFEERPDYVGGNPLQARFMKYLHFAVNNIRKNKIPRLADVEHRPQGTVSLGQGRSRGSDPAGGVSPDEIVARRSHEADLAELADDLTGLLRRKEIAYPLPLVSLLPGNPERADGGPAAGELRRPGESDREASHRADDPGVRREKRQLRSAQPAQTVRGLSGEQAGAGWAATGKDSAARAVRPRTGLRLDHGRPQPPPCTGGEAPIFGNAGGMARLPATGCGVGAQEPA